MRIFIISLMVISCLSGQAYSRDGGSFGVFGGIAIPGGDAAQYNGKGGQFGIIGRVATSNPLLRFSIGGSITRLSSEGKHVTYGGYPSYSTVLEKEYNPISFFAGVQFGKETGIYFLPAMALNIAGSDPRFGLDWRIGALLPANENASLDLGATLSILNLINKETEEDTNTLLAFHVGIVF